MKIQMMLLGTAALCAVPFANASAQAHAQQSPKFKEIVEVSGRTSHAVGELTVAFSAPVSLPGISLAPGKYIFRQPSINVVQVADLNGQPYAMIMTVPTIRHKVENGYSFVLGPGLHADSPHRLLAMFAPGETTGQQFVYPAK